MLSTIPDRTADTPRRLIADKVTFDPTKSFKNSAKVFVTPVLTKGPTIMNGPAKKAKLRPSMSGT
jgi:hypothetical protein